MYRQYENPYELNKYLCKLEAEYQTLIEMGVDADEEDFIDLYEEILDIKERINFAWQDEEYDEMNRDYADEMWMWENCYNTDMDWDEDVQIMYEESEIMREYGEI